MTKTGKKRYHKKRLIKTNKLYDLWLIVVGIIFIAIPGKVASVLPYALIVILLSRSMMIIYKCAKPAFQINKAVGYSFAVMGVALSALLIVFRERQSDIVAIIMAAYAVMEIAECIYEIATNKNDKRKVFINGFKIVIYAILFPELLIELGKSLPTQIVVYGIMFFVQGAVDIFSDLISKGKGNTLIGIMSKSHTWEILAGLMIVIVGAAVLLPIFEPDIKNFGDGLWYSFMLITTIGFGDMTAVTSFGRIISVIVGLYGIIVVALITSILVNLYTEQKAKEDAEKQKEKGEK